MVVMDGVRKDVLSLNSKEARKFFLSGKRYVDTDLPDYFDFQPILDFLSSLLKVENDYWKCCAKKRGATRERHQDYQNPKEREGVNYTLIANKDGKNAWRPITLIHPLLYVNLVNIITEKKNWEILIKHFRRAKKSAVRCVSIPIVTDNEVDGKKEQILEWWENFERESIKSSMHFCCVAKTDISDCYNSIYTHSICWALDGKKRSKNTFFNRTAKSARYILGDKIDKSVEQMRSAQTKGIPQGAVLMDLIAEIVLCAIDLSLTERLKSERINEFNIIRYRDDYRIYSRSRQDAEIILKLLGDELREYGLSLNSKKTHIFDEIVMNSVKEDKWNAITSPINCLYDEIQGERLHLHKFESFLMQIYDFSIKYENSGQLCRFLNNISGVIPKKQRQEDWMVSISILTEIARMSPRTYPSFAHLVSIMLKGCSSKFKERMIESIIEKFANVPNTDFLNIWLQRLCYRVNPQKKFNTELCAVVVDSRDVKKLWNNAWIKPSVRKKLEQCDIVDRNKLANIDPIISRNEVSIFANRHSS